MFQKRVFVLSKLLDFRRIGAMMDSDDPEYGAHSDGGSEAQSDVEIIESSHTKSPSIATQLEPNAAGWITEGPPANWEVAVSAIPLQFAPPGSVGSQSRPSSLNAALFALETVREPAGQLEGRELIRKYEIQITAGLISPSKQR